MSVLLFATKVVLLFEIRWKYGFSVLAFHFVRDGFFLVCFASLAMTCWFFVLSLYYSLNL
jgi:hypothetical protein